jgi:hypothetical protein
MTQLLDPTPLYNRFKVVLRIEDRIDGGVPKNPELIRQWIAARTGFDDEITKKLAEEYLPDIEKVSEEIAQSSWNGFAADDNGPYIMAHQVKAMLKTSAGLLGIQQKKRGSKQIIQHGFEIKGVGRGKKRIYLEDHSEIQTEEKPIHVDTPKGKRDALKRTDYVTSATLRFEIWVLKTHPNEKRHIGEAELRLMLTHAQEEGLGANRSQGEGKFEVLEFEAFPENENKAIPIPGAKEEKEESDEPKKTKGKNKAA